MAGERGRLMPHALLQAALPQQNPDWLQKINAGGQAVWRNANWPTRKTEHWKYTSLRPLEQGVYLQKVGVLPSPEAQRVLNDIVQIANLDTHRLVFVNGCYSAALSQIQNLPAGVDLVTFADASSAQLTQLQNYLGSVVENDRHIFAALNSQQLQDGVFLRVGKNVTLDKPVQVVVVTTPQTEAFHAPQRLLVVLEPNASATVIEQFVSDTQEQNGFVHSVTELCLLEGARCEHYRMHLEEQQTLHLGGVHVSLGRSAQLQSFHLALGSALKRIDIVINHNGEGAHCQLNGVYLPRLNQHVDYHTCIEHRVPHCTSNEIFRGIIADSAKAVFNGRIHIHPGAQKTLAQLSNKNLLTSDKAEVDTKPELEIYADDVQCSHGATVAQLDATALHYFRARGISQAEAEAMLSFGFINELINTIGQPALIEYLRPVLTQWFARDPALVRHLI
jgi:Fe-S cluster assembly protein SufD